MCDVFLEEKGLKIPLDAKFIKQKKNQIQIRLNGIIIARIFLKLKS